MSLAEFTDSTGRPWDDFAPQTDGEASQLALSDRAGADRHLAAIARIEAEYELEKVGALAEVERIQRWVAARYEATVAQTDWHREILHRYHEAVLALDPRLKTIKLPHGELQARAQQPSWEIDGLVFLAWAQENLPEAVRPPKPGEPTVDVAAVKRLVTVAGANDEWTETCAVSAAGEIVPGVKIIARDQKFSTVIAEPEPEDARPVEDDLTERVARLESALAAEDEADDGPTLIDGPDLASDFDADHGADF